MHTKLSASAFRTISALSLVLGVLWLPGSFHPPQIPARIPTAQVVLNNQQVHCSDWPLGATLTLTIDDPTTGVGIDYSDTKVVGSVIPPDETFVLFDLSGHFEVKPGFSVTVTDGITPKALSVRFLKITLVDAQADKIYGQADPGVQIRVWVSGGTGMTVQADPSGNWVADFSQTGGHPYDLRGGTTGSATIDDADEDGTQYYFRVNLIYLPQIVRG
jgi:hypothetical protein